MHPKIAWASDLIELASRYSKDVIQKPATIRQRGVFLCLWGVLTGLDKPLWPVRLIRPSSNSNSGFCNTGPNDTEANAAASELELELIQTQMAQKPMLRAEV